MFSRVVPFKLTLHGWFRYNDGAIVKEPKEKHSQSFCSTFTSAYSWLGQNSAYFTQ